MDRGDLHSFRLLAYLVMMVAVVASPAVALQPSAVPTSPEITGKQAILLGILRSINQLEDELKAKREELRSPQAEGRQDEVVQQIKKIADKLTLMRENLNEVASGVDLDAFSTQADVDPNWQKRLYDLLRPLINELTRLTARPREIEQLRTLIEHHQEQLQIVGKAQDSIGKLLAQRPDSALIPALQQLQNDWEARRQDIATQLSIASQQLSEKLNAQQPFSESVKSLFQLFFRSRGRNFLIACVAFIAFWLLFQRLQGWIQRFRLLHRKGQTFSVRLFNVLFTAFTIFGATFAFLFVLYFFEDWVLLTVAILFLVGIAWTSKSVLPGFLDEVTLLLNLGAVREGERVVYNGVPWHVHSLNFYAQLVNPDLTGGDIRLPLRDLLDLRSRPSEPGEPWFPTRINDWILLNEETLGKVVLQTPEVVRLVLHGGSRRTFSTGDFLALSPMVLSTGFRLSVQFGVDYQHQALITQEIPAKLAARLCDDLAREGYEQDIVNLKVEFDEAAASSLNLRVLADFAGEAAPSYQILRRALQRFCVDACNDNGWVIPFTQLTLHVASTSDKAALPDLEGALQGGGRNISGAN
jgi:small-conductance mechanosensitive channel